MEAWYYIILAGMTILMMILGMKTSMLRDDISDAAQFQSAAAGQPNARPPFSLGRTQLAFWTVIVISSFLYVLIYQHYDAVPVLASSSLALLGISAGTTVAAKTVDDSQSNAPRHQNAPSQGLLLDLISDQKGVSIHRLQNLIWMLIIGSIYIHFVASSNSLPGDTVITAQLLALMGISAGTYVGLKINENSAASTAAANNANTIAGNNNLPAPPQQNAIVNMPPVPPATPPAAPATDINTTGNISPDPVPGS